MELRPYQQTAIENIFYEWQDEKRNKTLLVLATGLGKTICFCKVAEQCVIDGERVLILAHRGELLDQAADKLHAATGLNSSLEKAGSSCLDSHEKIVVGSVQTLQNQNRLERFDPDYFQTIIVDEAHHALSPSYQRVLNYFNNAKILGVTATPDRGDKKNLGQFFDSIAYEYSIAQGIKDGYLSPIKAQTIPLKIDLTEVKQSAGDFSSGDLGYALDPYLEGIADEMVKRCLDRKTIVFLPLIATSKKFRDILNEKGFHAEEINGTDKPDERKEKIKAFEEGKINVLCNSMLLTEGFDCPSIDCVVCLRPTKIRSLYTQIVGRGTRLSPGKEFCLILDFLWHSEQHQLCRPAHLITDDPKKQEVMTKALENYALKHEDNKSFDLERLEILADTEIARRREAALAQQLSELRNRKERLVDPLQWEVSIGVSDLDSYEPTMPWEMKPPTEKQLNAIQKAGIDVSTIDTAGKAHIILDRLSKRREMGLTTAKQIRLLERYGFRHVGTWKFESANKLIDLIKRCGWKVPRYITPATYKPEGD